MRSMVAILALCAVLSVSLVTLGGAARVPDPAQTLDFLAGTWQGDKWGGIFVAYYSTPVGGKVLSYSELIKDGKVSFHEFEKFETIDSQLTLTPYPGGRPAPIFTETKVEPKRVVFENPEKDFPTRITYEQVSAESLRITLDDPHHAGGKTDVFELKRPSTKNRRATSLRRAGQHLTAATTSSRRASDAASAPGSKLPSRC